MCVCVFPPSVSPSFYFISYKVRLLIFWHMGNSSAWISQMYYCQKYVAYIRLCDICITGVVIPSQRWIQKMCKSDMRMASQVQSAETHTSELGTSLDVHRRGSTAYLVLFCPAHHLWILISQYLHYNYEPLPLDCGSGLGFFFCQPDN